ncbi:hypothetical protein GCM10010252_25730 [Streptomyces aureoverticillatus]|nr:hypothetical protein GCM10010252_25730 [Streptomyces aureoverticillatus]
MSGWLRTWTQSTPARASRFASDAPVEYPSTIATFMGVVPLMVLWCCGVVGAGMRAVAEPGWQVAVPGRP